MYVAKSGAFSSQYIDALAECITGGAATIRNKPIGLYRSGPKIVAFFRRLGHDVEYGQWSRVPFTQDLLNQINREEKGFEKIAEITVNLLDPRGYLDSEDKLESVLEYLNKYLKYDGLEIVKTGTSHTLVKIGGSAPVIEDFGDEVSTLPNVKADFDRALSNIDSDASGAITSACSTLESIAKLILDGLGKPYPKDQSIQPLVIASMKELQLAPDQQSEIEIKRILGSLFNVTAGIGVLRTKYGDAHGKGKEFARLLPRHARLAVNAASTVGLFLLETYLEIRG
jgi:hypothetical protein